MKKVFSILIMSLLLIACGADDNSNDDGSNEELFLKFTAQGTTFELEPASTTSLVFSISGFEGLNETFVSINLTMPVDVVAGTYEISDALPSDLEAYTANYARGLDTFMDATFGTLVISSFQGEFMEGTFSFIGTDNNGNSIAISDGSFRAYNNL